MVSLFIILVFIVIVIGLIAYSDIPVFLLVFHLFRITKNTKESAEDIMQTIDQMNGDDFEKWCADLLHRNGFAQIEVTDHSSDQGVDIIALKDGKKYAIQCKRYGRKLSNKPIQEVHTGKTIYNCDVAAVITNNFFTAGAKKSR